MRISSAGLSLRFRLEPDLVRHVVWVNGAVPITLLCYDAWQHKLGANGVNFALHTTGLLALIFFVLSLMVTPLKRITGSNELVAARRSLGLYGFFYLVVHFSIFFVFDRGGSMRSTVHEILARRYLQLGTIALLLFIPLAVTSTDRMITRLGPRRWKRLHRLTYVATSLGATHYILLVKSDIRQPVVFAAVIGSLFVFRIAASAIDRRRRNKRKPWSGELTIARVVEETHDVRTFRFVPRVVTKSGQKMPFLHKPGQYMNLSLMINGERVNRSYTIASAPTHRDYCEITVKRADAGFASHHLHDAIREGSIVKVTAPAGRFVFEGERSSRVLLIAGGVGITPVMAMARTLVDRQWSGRIDLIFSVKTQKDIIFARELDEMAARSPNFHLHVTLTREPEAGWAGDRGQISRELIERVTTDVRSVPIYLCGPDPMMAAIKTLLVSMNAPDENIHVEAFVSPPRAPSVESNAPQEQEDELEETPARADGVTVQFAKSGASTSVEEGQTLLEAAEEIGVDIPFDCRSGICGQCKTKLVRGRVVMDVQEALTDDDRKRHLVLACQARPVRDVIVDA